MSESTLHTSHGQLDGLRQLRDEIRLKVHLAHLEAQQKWEEIEQQLEALEHRIKADGNLVEATGQLARDLKQSLVDFHRRLSA